MGGLLILTSFVLSPSVVTVPGTDWVEPTPIWLTISMPTGSRKTTVYQFRRRLLQDIRQAAGCSGRLCTITVSYVITVILLINLIHIGYCHNSLHSLCPKCAVYSVMCYVPVTITVYGPASRVRLWLYRFLREGNGRLITAIAYECIFQIT